MHGRRIAHLLTPSRALTAHKLPNSRVQCLRLASSRLYSSKPPATPFLDEEQPLEEITYHEPDVPNKSSEELLSELGKEDVQVHTPPPEESPTFDQFPDLMQYDILMDSRQVLDFPADKTTPYANRVVIRNEYKSLHIGQTMFEQQLSSQGIDTTSPSYKFEKTDDIEEEMTSEEYLPLNAAQLSKLYKFPIFGRRVVKQTGKGKMSRIYTMMVVGNGDGMVGLGEGKAEEAAMAYNKAYVQAVRNMDYVERFEKRTVWTEMETKLGSTKVILRPRPVGFGLRCNPNLHQVLKAAGIKDVSAKVWGSRNPVNVIKATFRMLQAGHAPLGMGDGVGGKGKKLNQGHGAKGAGQVEMERGRKLLSLRT